MSLHQPLAKKLRVLRAAALGVGLLLACEWCLRGIGFAWPSEPLRFIVLDPEQDARIRAGESSLKFDRDCLWVPVEGAPTGFPGEVHGRDGIVGTAPPLERASGTVRVLVLGSDSTVAAAVAPAERWPERMRAQLESHGLAAEVVNAAVPRHSLRQGLERLRQLGPRWKPDLVVAAYSMSNSCRPAPMELSDAERMEAVRANPDLLADWDALALFDSLRVCHALRWMAAAGFDKDYWEGRYSWFVGRRYLQRWQQAEWGGERRVMPDEYELAALAIAREARSIGARPMFMVLPSAPGATDATIKDRYSAILASAALASSTPLLDGRAAISTAKDPGALFDEDEDLNACGHDLLGYHAASELLHLLEERR
ncbi:MAG: hypothetical protein RL112_2463 [Planctomycetota bacterium]